MESKRLHSLLLPAILLLIWVNTGYAQSELFGKDTSVVAFDAGVTLSGIHSELAIGVSGGLWGRLNAGISHRNFNATGEVSSRTGGYLEGLVIKTPGKFRIATGIVVLVQSQSRGNDCVATGLSLYLVSPVAFGCKALLMGVGARNWLQKDHSYGEKHDDGFLGMFSEGIAKRLTNRLLICCLIQQSVQANIGTEFGVTTRLAIRLGHH